MRRALVVVVVSLSLVASVGCRKRFKRPPRDAGAAVATVTAAATDDELLPMPTATPTVKPLATRTAPVTVDAAAPASGPLFRWVAIAAADG